MAMAALANETKLEKKQVLELYKEFKELAKKQGNSCTISKPQMKEALGLVGVIETGSFFLIALKYD